MSLLEHVPPDRLAALGEDKEIKIGKYTHPVLHRIAIDGRNPVLRNRSLRRGLSSAIDRKAILEETVLKHAGDAANAPSDGAFAADSFANAPDVKPLVHDPLIARMLVTAARREMGNAPIKLTLEYPAIPEARAAVPKIAEAFTAAGIELKTVERPESELEEALRSGRKFDLAYRAGPCAQPRQRRRTVVVPGVRRAPGRQRLGIRGQPASCSSSRARTRCPSNHRPRRRF